MLHRLLYWIASKPGLFLFLRKTGRMNFFREKLAIRQHLKGLQAGAKVLQIACGSGYFSMCFSKQEFYGTDTSPANVAYAKKHFKGTYKILSTLDLDFGDQSMDAVLLMGVFHNIDDPTSVHLIKEIKRVLKTSGKLLILEDVFPVSPFSFVNIIAQRYDPPAFIRTPAEYLVMFEQGIKLAYGGKIFSGAGRHYLFYN